MLFLLGLLGGRSVLWCLIRLTCATWGTLAIALMCLAVDFEDSIFLACCLTLLLRNLSKSMLGSLMVLETNSSSFKEKNPENICAKYLQFLVATWQGTPRLCTALYHSSTEWLPCLKLVSRSNLALTALVYGLQKSSKFAHMTSKLRSSGGKDHDTYWSTQKSLLCVMTFLYFLESGNMASSQSNMFSHFSIHLRNLCVQAIIHSPVHLWPFNIWHKHGLHKKVVTGMQMVE